jgi:hypothetical protein
MSDEGIYRAFEEKVRRAIEELAADVRRQASAEADTIRRGAAAEAAGMLAEAERRRNELLGEIQRLERQLATVSAGIQALLRGEINSDAGGGGAEATRAEPRPASAVPTAAPAPSAEAPAAAGAPPPPPPEPAREPPPPAVAAARPPALVLSPPSDAERTEISVAGTPSFARALELQRGIQRTAGVRHVQALQFEHGTLVLAVEHEPGIDLAEAVTGLPNVELVLVGAREGRLDLAFS